MTTPPTLDPGRWLDAHGDALFRFALMSVRDRSAAEDLVQEALLAALQARDSFAGQSNERTWLTAVLKRKVADHFRRAARAASALSQERDDVAAGAFTSAGKWRVGPADWGAAADSAMQQREFSDVLRGCLDGLPERWAAALALRDISGLSGEEVCNILGLSATNLSTMLHRARARLRDCLERKWFKPRPS